MTLASVTPTDSRATSASVQMVVGRLSEYVETWHAYVPAIAPNQHHEPVLFVEITDQGEAAMAMLSMDAAAQHIAQMIEQCVASHRALGLDPAAWVRVVRDAVKVWE